MAFVVAGYCADILFHKKDPDRVREHHKYCISFLVNDNSIAVPQIFQIYESFCLVLVC